MTGNRNLLKLNAEQKQELQRWAQSRTLPAGDVFRARLLLALAEGITYREIARSMKTSTPTVARWKMRFEQDGMAGLEGRHRGSKPRAATPAVRARVIRRVQQKPGDGSTHWSCRKLAKELGLSKSTVQRIRCRRNSSRIDWNATWPATIRISKPRRRTSLGCTCIRPSMRLCFAWTKRPRFRLWIGWIRCCRCLRVGRNDMVSSTTAMAPYRYMPPWT